MTGQKELYIIYESWQIDSARSHVARDATIVCLDYVVEQELKRENIPCISLRDVVDAETGEGEWWLLAQDVAREWYRLPSMKFFEYGGIRIGEVVEPIMAAEYLTKLFYYARIYTALGKAYPGAHLTIPALIVDDAPTDDCLVSFERRAAIDAARMLRLRFDVAGKPVEPRKRSVHSIDWKLVLVRAYHLFIRLAPRRRLKIYACEYWSHIGPVIERMSDTELVLMTDSSELRHIPWRQLLAHRVRIRHPNDAIRGADRTKVVRLTKEFVEQWVAAKKEVATYLAGVHRELDWSPVLEACEYLMTDAARVIADIDALCRIMTEEDPNLVLQLASVGGRGYYFLIMAHIASQLGIPSVELQHSASYVDPRVVFSRIETDYLATYGNEANSWYERTAGHARNQLISVGSPRFDRYLNEHASARKKGKVLLKQLGLNSTRPVLFVSVPFTTDNFFHLDSYQLAEFFETIRSVQRTVPGLQVLFKCRNYRYVASARAYLEGIFDADFAVTGSEDIFALLCASDAGVCGCSTVLFQVMLAGKPLIFYPWKIYNTYHAQMYAQAAPFGGTAEEVVGYLTRVFADVSYRDELLARQKRFLGGYAFDGHSSERIAGLIERLTRT